MLSSTQLDPVLTPSDGLPKASRTTWDLRQVRFVKFIQCVSLFTPEKSHGWKYIYITMLDSQKGILKTEK